MPNARLLALLFVVTTGCAAGSVAMAGEPPTDQGPAETTAPAATRPGFVQRLADTPTLEAPSKKAWVQRLATGDNAFVGILTMAPGAAVPEHQDPTEEYIYVLAGSGTLVIDGQSHEIGPETLVFMPAYATVSYQNGDAELRALQVFAGPGPAAKYEAWTPVPAK